MSVSDYKWFGDFTSFTLQCCYTDKLLRALRHVSKPNIQLCRSTYWLTATALHQGAPGQMTWQEDLLPWLRPAYPCVLLCFGDSVNSK